ncbi:MAG: PAS domain-containing sensor histidine kinase [Flavobacteriaceae bacterium]
MKTNKIFTANYLVRQLPQATAFINKKFEFVYVSDLWNHEFEVDNIDILGKSIYSTLNIKSNDWKNCLKKSIKGTPGKITIRNQNETKWLEWKNIPWYDEKENIIGAIVQLSDITEHISTGFKLEKLEILFNEKSEITKTGTWEYDAITEKVHWCHITKAIHEVPEDFEPSLELAIGFFMHGYCRNAIFMAIENALSNGFSWSGKLEILTANGMEKTVNVVIKPIFHNEKLFGLIGSYQDVTEQIKAEKKTKENERLLQTLIDNLPISLYIKDRESRKILVNKAECDFVGLGGPEKIIGKNDFDLFEKETAQIARDEDLRLMTTLEPVLAREHICVKKDGSKTTFSVYKVPFFNEQNEVAGVMGMSIDISEIKQKEKELNDLIEVTLKQNKKLIEFAHIVSHNLRSHTANFSMLLGFLIDEENEQEKDKILKMLSHSSDSLLETLNNLNEVVAINTNLTIEKEMVKLRDYVNMVEENLKGFLINNNAKIRNQISEDVEINVYPSYLKSILMNFITNAIKFKMPNRKPVVILSTRRRNGYTVLSIEDNSSGIDLKKYGDKLFGMYKTFHDHKEAKGIGLYVSKNQILAMNGKVEVDSTVGIGSTFKIYFNEKN